MATSLAEQPVLKMSAPDLRSDLDLSVEETMRLLRLAIDMKRDPAHYATALQGRSLSLLFEKPSLRTRLTFELAIQQLGGYAVTSIGMIGDREPLKDVARNLDRWTQGIVARVFAQSTIEGLAEWSRVPVISVVGPVTLAMACSPPRYASQRRKSCSNRLMSLDSACWLRINARLLPCTHMPGPG